MGALRKRDIFSWFPGVEDEPAENIDIFELLHHAPRVCVDQQDLLPNLFLQNAHF